MYVILEMEYRITLEINGRRIVEEWLDGDEITWDPIDISKKYPKEYVKYLIGDAV
jgi:hypothetical protein